VGGRIPEFSEQASWEDSLSVRVLPAKEEAELLPFS